MYGRKQLRLFEVLINGVMHDVDGSGYSYCSDKDGEKVRGAWHRTIQRNASCLVSGKRNIRIISGGCVYIFNYNIETFPEGKSIHFDDYQLEKNY